MKSKKNKILLTVIALAGIIIVFVIMNQLKNSKDIKVTGAIKEMYCYSGEYKALIQSNEVGHPGPNSDFTTSYRSDLYIRENYKFMYDIKIDVNLKKSSVYKEYPAYNSMKEIKIFNKNLKYEQISNEEIVLIYKYYENFYIKINLKDYSKCYNLEGNYIRDEKGNVLMLETYDFLEFVKENKAFSETLNITISKK